MSSKAAYHYMTIKYLINMLEYYSLWAVLD